MHADDENVCTPFAALPVRPFVKRRSDGIGVCGLAYSNSGRLRGNVYPTGRLASCAPADGARAATASDRGVGVPFGRAIAGALPPLAPTPDVFGSPPAGAVA